MLSITRNVSLTCGKIFHQVLYVGLFFFLGMEFGRNL